MVLGLWLGIIRDFGFEERLAAKATAIALYRSPLLWLCSRQRCRQNQVIYFATNVGSVGDQPTEVTGKEQCKSAAVPQL